MSAATPQATHRSYCRFCIALCGIRVTTEGDQVVKVTGDPDHPVSQGYACPKGRALPSHHHHPERLDHPLIDTGNGLGRAAWDTVLDDIAERLGDILRTTGPDGVGVYLATASAFDAAGRRTANKLMRALGSRSVYTSTTVDTPCKPLVSELMSGIPALVPALDHENAEMVLLFGTNPVVSHGHINAFPAPRVRLRQMQRRGAQVWVIDPRRTETAKLADHHLALRPGTDYALLGHAVRELLREGADHAYLAEHAEGVEGLAAAVEPFDEATAADITGLAPEEVAGFRDAVRRAGRIAGQTGTGVTMSAAANVSEWLLWALHVVTGSYDRPGGMWFNPGYLHEFDGREWAPSDGTPGPGPPSRPELPQRWGEIPCAAMADEIESGNLRALVVAGGNPMTSIPDAERLGRAFRKLDALVVADVVPTDTTRLATHVLPCTGQLERADVPHTTDQFYCVVGSNYTPAIVPPTAERKPMWWPFAKIAEALGHDVLPAGLDADHCTDDDVLRPIADRSRSDFDTLRSADNAVVSEQAVFGWVHDKVLPEGRWRVAPDALVDQLGTLRSPDALVLIPRRQLRHLNSQLREPELTEGRDDLPQVLIHPRDAQERAIDHDDDVEVRSPTGAVSGRACVTDDIRRGALSVPHGFGDPNACALTSDTRDVDPLTGMALQSGVPVEVVVQSSRADPVAQPTGSGT